MKITVDTNVMVSSFVRNDQAQANTAAKILTCAAIIAIALPSLCKFVRVLQSIYIIENADAIGAFRANGQQKRRNEPAGS
jgi:predicted nucleic-acid-binding protein